MSLKHLSDKALDAYEERGLAALSDEDLDLMELPDDYGMPPANAEEASKKKKFDGSPWASAVNVAQPIEDALNKPQVTDLAPQGSQNLFEYAADPRNYAAITEGVTKLPLELGALAGRTLKKGAEYVEDGMRNIPDSMWPIRTMLRPNADALNILQGLLPTKNAEVAAAATSAIPGGGTFRIAGKPTAQGAFFASKGLETTAAEATGSPMLGKLESALRNLDRGGDIDQLRMKRANEVKREAIPLLEKQFDAKKDDVLQRSGQELFQAGGQFQGEREAAQMAQTVRIKEIEKEIEHVTGLMENAQGTAEKKYKEKLKPLQKELSELLEKQSAGVKYQQEALGKLSPLAKSENADPMKAGYGVVRDLAQGSRTARKAVKDAYSQYEAAAEALPLTNANDVAEVIKDKLGKLREAIKTSPKNAQASRLENFLGELVGIDSDGVITGPRPVKVGELIQARRDINFLNSREGYKNTSLEGVAGGTSPVGKILEEVGDAIDLHLAKIGRSGARGAEEFNDAGQKAREEFMHFASTYRSRTVAKLKNKSPEQIMKFVTATDSDFNQIRQAIGEEGVKKLTEHNHAKLFEKLLKDDNPVKALAAHLDPDNMPRGIRAKMYPKEVLEDFQKLAYGREYSKFAAAEKQASLRSQISETKTTFAEKFKGLSEQGSKEVGRLENEARAVIAKTQERIDALEKKLKDSAGRIDESAKAELARLNEQKAAEIAKWEKKTDILAKRETDATGAVVGNRAGDKVPGALGVGADISAMGAMTAGVVGMSVGQPWGLKAAVAGAALAGLRLSPKILSRLYTSKRGRDLLIDMVQKHGTPEFAANVGKLETYLATRKILGIKDDEEN